MKELDCFQEIRDEGLRLWKLGYLALPTYPDAKGPRRKGWTRIPMPQTERDFWDTWDWPLYKKAALSMTCNTSIVIIDVDNELPAPDPVLGYSEYLLDDITKNPMLADKTMRYLSEQGIDLTASPISQTRKGGYHLYYSAKGLELSNVVQKRLKTPDGLLLIDPRLPNKGAAMEYPTAGYKWLKPLVPIDELPPLPQQYIDWMARKEEIEGIEDADSLIDRLNIEDKEVNPLLELVFATLQTNEKYSLGYEALHHRNEHMLPAADLCYWGAGLSAELTQIVLTRWAEFCGYEEPDTASQIKERVRAAVAWSPSKKGYIGYLRRILNIPMVFTKE